MGGNLHHVITRPGAELLEGEFERQRPGAAETGTDDS
jgi:hypothetical protein